MGKILTTYSAFFVFSVLFFTLKTNAQSNTTDSSVVLDYKSFMQIVMDHHPMSAKADLKENFGDAVLQMAKGAFDPKAFTSLDQKYFDGYKILQFTGRRFKITYLVRVGIEIRI
jgi:hypothetical protein